MSMSSLAKNIDDQFVPEVRLKAALEKFAPTLTPNPAQPEQWHQRAQITRYEDANDVPVSTVRYFGELARENGVYPEPDEQKFWEDWWLAELGVHRKWHEPRRERKVKAFASDWWSMQKLFEDQGCPAWPEAPNATVQKAFQTSTLQSVFPIFFDTHIVAGLLANPVLERLIARTVAVN